MLTGDEAEGDRMAEGQARMEERIVRSAVELAAQVADGIETRNHFAVFFHDPAKLIGEAVMEEQRM